MLENIYSQNLIIISTQYMTSLGNMVGKRLSVKTNVVVTVGYLSGRELT